MLEKYIKILLKKKKKKSVRIIMNVIKNLSEEQKQKLVEYMRNCYLAHKNSLVGHYVDFLKILGQLNIFMSWIEIKKRLKFVMSLKVFLL